ncbi:MAG TPA: AMP-binding protein [Pseudomonadales bacterium]
MAAIPLSRILASWAQQQPDRVAVTHEGRDVTFAQLDASSNRLARAYEQLGVEPNDFVTIALPNSIAFFDACFACWKLGATPQPVSAKLPKFELDQIIEVGNPKLVVGVADGAHAGVTTLPVGYQADPALSSAPLPERTAISWKAMTSGGSTGRPKLIVTKQPATRDPDEPFLNFGMRGSVLIPGPLYHNGPFMWATGGLFKGNTVSITTRFDAEQTLHLIESQRVDTIYLVPTMMQRIWNLPDDVRRRYDVSSLKTLWHLAAPCPAWLKEAFIEWLGADVIWELYGGTEGQGGTVITGPEWLAHRGSVGKPNATCEMKVVDEQGRTLPPGEVGEVFMRPLAGPGTTYRYIGAEAKSMDGGWESLGDMGSFDADGYLYLSDRQTDMILSGGANIYPAEVEAAIDAFPGVRSSAVIGLPHVDLGNYIHAIVDAPGGAVTKDALLAHLADRLVRYKLPRTVEFVDEPLRDDAGKVRRKQLRAERLAKT